MISDRLPDPSDLAITLSQRLADLLSPVEMARLRVLSRKPVSHSDYCSTTADLHLATKYRLSFDALRRAAEWAFERYGHERSQHPGLCYSAVRIARSHGYVVEAILDTQEASS